MSDRKARAVQTPGPSVFSSLHEVPIKPCNRLISRQNTSHKHCLNWTETHLLDVKDRHHHILTAGSQTDLRVGGRLSWDRHGGTLQESQGKESVFFQAALTKQNKQKKTSFLILIVLFRVSFIRRQQGAPCSHQLLFVFQTLENQSCKLFY